MASSQVEIASSSPFGCVLRDHDQRDQCRESNARVAFQKNLKELVRDHLHTCISINSQHQTDNHDWRNNHRNFSNNNREESSQILDRWAARMQNPKVEVQLLALSNSQTASSSSSTLVRHNSLAPSHTCVHLPNLGASSLVQMWEARLNRSSSRTNSGLSYPENASTLEDPSRGSEVCDSADETYEAQVIHEDSFGNGESDRTAPSDPPSSDAGESERIRVADIIKRLTLANSTQSSLTSCSDDNDHEQTSTNGSPSRDQDLAFVSDHAEQRVFSQIMSSPRIRARSSGFPQTATLPRIIEFFSAFDQGEQRGFSQVVNSPWLRGRQAFNELLMQMERDRQRELDTLVERQPVSRFPQRGRIQSMLRLRFLQRALAVQDQLRPQSTEYELNQLQGSTIALLRERFNTGVEHGRVTAPSGEANMRSPRREIINNSQELGNSSTLTRLNEDNHHQEVDTIERHSTPPAQHLESYASEDLHEEASLSSDVTWQETSFEAGNLDPQEAADNSWDENLTAEEQEANNQQLIGTNYDWCRDISRPRRYWEGRREAWYQEMLDTNSHNEEIWQLLQRKRVSTSLSSDFRQRMDQVMMSQLHRQMQSMGSLEEEQDEVGSQERMDELMSFLRRHTHQVGSQEEEEEIEQEQEELEEEVDEEEEEEEEEESPIRRQYHEVSDYFDQTASPLQLPLLSLMSSWSSYGDHELGDDSDQVESTSLRQPIPSQSYCQDTRQSSSSSTNRPSIEMELIYDLRGQMEQLHHEMSELRKSLKSCTNMQMKLQHSIKQEVHSGRGEGKKSLNNRAPRRGSCCICYEMLVDSLLYRCGHMCTCLKCAHELQWSSGKCPICRAPIVDVVRAYADS